MRAGALFWPRRVHAKHGRIYHAADGYVSPYRAEGFNLPVLEACACGTPVICTKGGPTDVFMSAEFSHFIESRVVAVTHGDMEGQLEPELDHLIQLMLRVMDDDGSRETAVRAGGAHVAANFNWDLVVSWLLGAIFDRDKKRPRRY